jgi:Fe-S cluster assembly protein SufB
MAPEGLPALADHEGAHLGQRPLPEDRLPGHHLLRRAQKQKGDGPRAWTRSIRSCCETYEKLGIPLQERELLAGVAVDAVFDSVSVATTFKEQARRDGRHLLLVLRGGAASIPTWSRNISARWCRTSDNFFAALNSAVFTDGSFCYVPKGVRCPMELSTYFRINAANTGQFERTLIIADEGAYVSYLEGCTAPMRDENQLHAAVVELVALDDAQIKYSTVQNWYPGDKNGKGGIYNFVTKRGACRGPQFEDFLDAGGDRLGHHLEISELHPAATIRSASSTRWR